ncbi:hypothetical protein Tco_0826374 [Tanacetum coccineum]
MVQKVKASDATSGEKDCSRIVSDKGTDQGLENESNTFGDESSRSRKECNDKITSGDDTDIRPSYDTEPMVEVPYTAEYNVFVVETQHYEQPECIINTCVVEKVDSNVIPNSPDMCDNDIQTDQNAKDERAALANLIANLKLDIDENKMIQKQLKKENASLTQELKECKSTLAETSRTLGESNIDYDKLERKLNETLGLLAQKEIDIKEGLKLKAYEISVVKEKHNELVKQSLLTKSHYEGLVEEKIKVITDLKLMEEKDIDKMISMEKQLKFLNEIVYKRNQSIQTILMLAPKGPTFIGRPTFANPMYLKMAQYEKLCLYEIPNDQSDPANRLVPNKEETLTLEKESRSKLNKDLVRPYDYTKLNSLYEIFKPAELVDQAWEKHSHNHFRAPTALDMEVLIKTCLMPLAIKTQNDSFAFVLELKQEMHADLKYVQSLEKEIDELKSDKAEFSNMYDIRSNDMVYNYYLEEAKKKAQLQKDKALNTKPSMQQSARLPNTTNGNKPKPGNFNQQPRNWPPSMSSRISNRAVNIAEPPRNQKTFLKLKDLACPTCKKCIYHANHDECMLKYLLNVHSHASTQKKDAQSHKTTKRYMPVEKKCDSKKHDRQIPIGQKLSPNKPSNVYLEIKSMPMPGRKKCYILEKQG